jgi:hypothetical protein
MMELVLSVTTCVLLVLTDKLVKPVKLVITELWIPLIVNVKPDSMITVLLLVKLVVALVPPAKMLPLVSLVKMDSNFKVTNAYVHLVNTKTDVLV